MGVVQRTRTSTRPLRAHVLSPLDKMASSEGAASATTDSEMHDSTDSTVTSVLDRLKSPTSSDLARKRRLQTNPPKGKKEEKVR